MKRCAIYTRKSTEEGLDQEFNSLDAQHQACAAYVASQAGEAWRPVRTRYDDGGYSGGTMDRPALQRLLEDIEAAKIDVVVVYKIDRLTRSLMDFAKIVEVFDGQGVSFVSVTQAFNTTTSMGRLTLNVLLSFAQFEREVTAERIRDKIAASKKKGMWMGGPTPLGYDVIDKKLVINEVEAVQVRRIFDLYLELGSVRQLKAALDVGGIVTKRRIQRNDRTRGGRPFLRGNLYQLLSNPTYIGKVSYRGELYAGQHDGIVREDVWKRVQELKASHTGARSATANMKSHSLLAGLLFDETGDRLSPSHAVKSGIRYRYYVSSRLMTATKSKAGGWRLPARELEGQILAALATELGDGLKLSDRLQLQDATPTAHKTIHAEARRIAETLRSTDDTQQKDILRQIVQRIELHPELLVITIDRAKLAAMLVPKEACALDVTGSTTIEIPHQMKRRGVEAKIVLGNSARAPELDENLISLVASAHWWLKQLTTGRVASISDLADQESMDRNEISRFLPLAFLAPEIVEAILQGTQPVGLTIKRLRRAPMIPHSWSDQRSLLGFTG